MKIGLIYMLLSLTSEVLWEYKIPSHWGILEHLCLQHKKQPECFFGKKRYLFITFQFNLLIIRSRVSWKSSDAI